MVEQPQAEGQGTAVVEPNTTSIDSSTMMKEPTLHKVHNSIDSDTMFAQSVLSAGQVRQKDSIQVTHQRKLLGASSKDHNAPE